MSKSHLHCHNNKIKELELIACNLRSTVIKMLSYAESGHTAGALGTADIFATLYFHTLEKKDRFVLSNGHICPILYATLIEKGVLPEAAVKTLREIDSPLQGHPHNLELPEIETSSGPLGQGLSQAVGMALAAKMDEKENRIYCMISDGELNEGQTWEALLFAGSKGESLNNLTTIIDRNNIQLSGNTKDILPLENLRDKLEAFNWYVIEINGHNIEEIINGCKMAKMITNRPTAIIAHTIPGKGVEFMEYKFEWHGKPPSKVQAQKALTQLRKLKSQIRKKYA